MHVAAQPADLRKLLAHAPRPVVLVPTMGALHEGHLALIKAARETAGPEGTVAVSIFVNPIQFDRKDDFSAYPRPMEKDLQACEAEGVDIVFTPDASSMYAADRSITVHEDKLSRRLCGATRPGHFDGVCTVVLKLFLLFGAEKAIFGKKDYQQLAIIRRMVRDLDVPIEIIGHPTLREADGLAMSSRNVRLTAEHRADAPRIRRALNAAVMHYQAGERSAHALLETARTDLEASPFLRTDYLELVDAETLEPIETVKGPALLATAVFYGDVRLIDNIELTD